MIDDFTPRWADPATVAAIQYAPVQLCELLGEIGAVFEAGAASCGQRLTVVIPPCNLALNADEELLRRVLYNLVDNGLRYTGTGDEVRVEVRVPDADHVELVITDNGPGIPPEHHEQIFEKYVRLACAGVGGSPPPVGHGLGLAFCRLAVEAHGGRIWVGDNRPRGSRFHVLLPARPPSASQ